MPANQRAMPDANRQQIIADPERAFALKLLDCAEKELQLAEAHVAVATDEQMKKIATETAASRRKEIQKLRDWLGKRKILRTPRMLER